MASGPAAAQGPSRVALPGPPGQGGVPERPGAEALADASATGSGGGRARRSSSAAARAKQPEPALATPAGANPIAASRLERRRVLAQGMVALVATPEARAESVAASEALLPTAPSPSRTPRGSASRSARAEARRGLPEGAPGLRADAVSLRLPDGAVPPGVRAPGLGQGARGPEGLGQEVPRPSGSGRWRPRIRWSRPPPKTSTPSSTWSARPPNIPGISTPTPAAATNELLAASSEDAPRSLRGCSSVLEFPRRLLRGRSEQVAETALSFPA